jgi:RNA polymerase sigma-70 factor (ECF subfamily)
VQAHDTTAALVVRAQRGEADAFEALARAYLRAAYSVALALVGRPADAEDVAQDAFVAAFERLDTCREPARFAGWLLQIVRNRARNWLDGRRLRDVTALGRAPEQGADDPSAAAVPVRPRLLEALRGLTHVQREVVLLHDLESWTHPEIAGALGISEVASRQHLFQAHRALRARLRDGAPNGGGS